MKLVVGLGNPGDEYKNTRHNIGFLAIDFLLNQLDQSNIFLYNNKYNAEIAKMKIGGQECVFCKPMTFMNKSGESVSRITNFLKIQAKDILILHDEIDLDTSRLQIKFGGSSAGHNGLKNIIEKIGTKDFRRIRLGINRPKNQSDIAGYVLSKLPKDELNQILSTENQEKIVEFTNKFMKD